METVTLAQYKARYWYILSQDGIVVGRIERSTHGTYNVFVNKTMTWTQTPCDDINGALGFATSWDMVAS